MPNIYRKIVPAFIIAPEEQNKIILYFWNYFKSKSKTYFSSYKISFSLSKLRYSSLNDFFP